MFPHNEQWKNRCFAIVSKCSMDLLVLLIETSKTEINRHLSELEQIKESIQATIGDAALQVRTQEGP